MTEPLGPRGERAARTGFDDRVDTRDDDLRVIHRDDRTAPLPQDASATDRAHEPLPGAVREPVTRTEPMTQADLGLDRRSVVRRERAEFGGIKWGSAFFGWLAAMGTAVILTALLTAVGAAIGISRTGSTSDAAGAVAENASTIGWAGGIALLVVLFVAYYCGGYVAGRMARFNGLRQGLAVWLWALAIAIVVGIVGAIAGSRYDILSTLNTFPRIPVDTAQVTTGGVVALLLAVGVTLVGAVLGGLAGMRFHRRVDRAGLEMPVAPSETV